jgi:hypothetical protein
MVLDLSQSLRPDATRSVEPPAAAVVIAPSHQESVP